MGRQRASHPASCKTSPCSEARGVLLEGLGQSTVEAAVLLPSLMLLLALILQPACLVYTRCVMQGAAAETARAALTSDEGATGDLEAFALRRLAAVPEVSVFHTGGDGDWDVRIEGIGSSPVVTIRGHVRPLPLLGVLEEALGEHDGQGVVVSVEARGVGRQSWVRGSYGDWLEQWEG